MKTSKSLINNLTLAFNRFNSGMVSESALAIIGTILTLFCRTFMHSISNDFNLSNLKTFHVLTISDYNGFESHKNRLPMTPRRNEIKAAMNSIIRDVSSIETTLIVQVPLELVIHILVYSLERVVAVDGLAEAGRVHNCQAELHASLLDFDRGGLDAHRLFDSIGHAHMRSLRIQVRQEQTVDESRLAKTGLANHHQSELEPLLDELAMHLVGQVGETHVALIVTGTRFI
jgi:hypothetical protein